MLPSACSATAKQVKPLFVLLHPSFTCRPVLVHRPSLPGPCSSSTFPFFELLAVPLTRTQNPAAVAAAPPKRIGEVQPASKTPPLGVTPVHVLPKKRVRGGAFRRGAVGEDILDGEVVGNASSVQGLKHGKITVSACQCSSLHNYYLQHPPPPAFQLSVLSLVFRSASAR